MIGCIRAQSRCPAVDIPMIPLTNLHASGALEQVSHSDLNPCLLGQRIALNELTTFPCTIEQDLEAYQFWQLPAIGVSWRKLLLHGVRRNVRSIVESGLKVSSLSWVGGVTGHHGYCFDDAIAEVKRAIRIAGQLRCPTLSVVTGPQNGHIDSHARRLIRLALQEVADLAKRYNVVLALQPMHSMFHQEWTFLHSLDDTLAVLEALNHPAVKLDFGTYHLGQEADLLSRIPEIVNRIGIVRLADRYGSPQHLNDREVPGEGCLPIQEIVVALEDAGYRGWYETEVWSRDLWKMNHHDVIERCLRSQARLFSTQLPVSESSF